VQALPATASAAASAHPGGDGAAGNGAGEEASDEEVVDAEFTRE
jgi:hypothetical protein